MDRVFFFEDSQNSCCSVFPSPFSLVPCPSALSCFVSTVCDWYDSVSFAAPIGTIDVPMGMRSRSETATVWRYDLMWKVMFSVRVRAILPVA